MQINKKDIFDQAKHLKIKFVVGSASTNNLTGLHVVDDGPASLSDALSMAISKGFDTIFLYEKDLTEELSKINTRLNLDLSEYNKIKVCLDNLKNTFGVDILKSVVMNELTLTEGK